MLRNLCVVDGLVFSILHCSLVRRQQQARGTLPLLWTTERARREFCEVQMDIRIRRRSCQSHGYWCSIVVLVW